MEMCPDCQRAAREAGREVREGVREGWEGVREVREGVVEARDIQVVEGGIKGRNAKKEVSNIIIRAREFCQEIREK